MSHVSSQSRASHSPARSQRSAGGDEEDRREPMDLLVGMFDELGVPPAPPVQAGAGQAEPERVAGDAGEAEGERHTGPPPQPSDPPADRGRTPFQTPASRPPTQDFDDAASIGAGSTGTAASLGTAASTTGSLASGRAATSLVRGEPPPWVAYPAHWPNRQVSPAPEMFGAVGVPGGAPQATAADGQAGLPPGAPGVPLDPGVQPQQQQQQQHPQGGGAPTPTSPPTQDPLRPAPPGRLDPAVLAPFQGVYPQTARDLNAQDQGGVQQATGMTQGGQVTAGIAGAAPPGAPPAVQQIFGNFRIVSAALQIQMWVRHSVPSQHRVNSLQDT